MLSPDFIQEDWAVIRVESFHFKERIFTYLSMEKDLLKYSNLFIKDLKNLNLK